MFKSTAKQKTEKENSTSYSSSSKYKESTQVQKSNNGGVTSTIITRQISSEAGHIRTTQERSIVHSASTGSVPPLSFRSQLPPLPTNTLTIGSSTTSLPTTSLSSTFRATSILSQPRSSFSFGSPSPVATRTTTPYRSAFFPPSGSYPSRSKPPALEGFVKEKDARTTISVPQVRATTNNDVIPTYPNNCSKRGRALIINNIKFIAQKDERHGAKKDSEDLSKLLKKMKFEIETKTDMKAKDMLKKVDQFSKLNFTSYDISIVVIMSHGSNIVHDGKKLVRMKGGYTEVAGVDNESLLIDDIIDKFTTPNCHLSLMGKPKIFIFQCCRGESDLEVAHDAGPIKNVVKHHSDILIAYSTLPGFLSNRHPKEGSWYIQSICKVFDRHYTDHHIEDMLKIVDDELSKKHPVYTQTAPFENRGFKRCYLHPRPVT